MCDVHPGSAVNAIQICRRASLDVPAEAFVADWVAAYAFLSRHAQEHVDAKRSLFGQQIKHGDIIGRSQGLRMTKASATPECSMTIASPSMWWLCVFLDACIDDHSPAQTMMDGPVHAKSSRTHSTLNPHL